MVSQHTFSNNNIIILLLVYNILCSLDRIRFPGFKIRVVCFDPNLQDLEGCMATPIDQLFTSSGRRKRNSSFRESHIFSEVVDRQSGEKLLEDFMRDVTPTLEEVCFK